MIERILEQVDPGHFANRYTYLLSLKDKFTELGFYPLRISSSDLLCCWLRFETTEGKLTSVASESLEDYLVDTNSIFAVVMRKALKYNES
jgi:hypothetical protein